MGMVQQFVPPTNTFVQHRSVGTKNPFIGANPFILLAVMGVLGKLLETAVKVVNTATTIQKSTGLSPLLAGVVGAALVATGMIGHAILKTQADEVWTNNENHGFTTSQTTDEFMNQFTQANPCLLVQAVATDDPNIFEFIAHPFNVPEGYRIEWSSSGQTLNCQGDVCRVRFTEGEHHVTAKLVVDDFETSVTLSRKHIEIFPLPSVQVELDQCDQQYLAHVAAGEASGTSSTLTLVAIMLSQINTYKASGSFANFRVIETFLERNNPNELANLYYISQKRERPENSEDLIIQSQAYQAYRSLCLAGTLAPAGHPNYNLALELAEQMQGISDSSDDIIPDLKVVLGSPHLQQENSFCTSVLDKIPEWEERANNLGYTRSPYVLSWYPRDNNHIIFEDTPRSIIIYSSGGSPIHRNWQCPQFVGQPTVHLNNSGICIQCNNGEEQFTNGIYQGCVIRPGDETKDQPNEVVYGIPQEACR